MLKNFEKQNLIRSNTDNECEYISHIYQYYQKYRENPFANIILLNNSNEEDSYLIHALVEKDNSLFFEYSYEDNFLYYIAFEGELKDKKILGVLSFKIDKFFINVRSLFSLTNGEKISKYRGIGTMLLNTLIKDYSKFDYIFGIYLTYVTLSIPFYKKLGFKMVDDSSEYFIKWIKDMDLIWDLDENRLNTFFLQLLSLRDLNNVNKFLKRGFRLLDSYEKRLYYY